MLSSCTMAIPPSTFQYLVDHRPDNSSDRSEGSTNRLSRMSNVDELRNPRSRPPRRISRLVACPVKGRALAFRNRRCECAVRDERLHMAYLGPPLNSHTSDRQLSESLTKGGLAHCARCSLCAEMHKCIKDSAKFAVKTAEGVLIVAQKAAASSVQLAVNGNGPEPPRSTGVSETPTSLLAKVA